MVIDLVIEYLSAFFLFLKSSDLLAFERRQEALLDRLQHLQGSVQKLRETVGLADSSTKVGHYGASIQVSARHFLANHVFWPKFQHSYDAEPCICLHMVLKLA